ncbi:hypothetical protein D1610_13975 [Sphingomonas gilva]|uniref:Uncharacterized protein n=1 Tax=Sphingomonas gilva TaxID=2305907 RepID=A0A396RKL7_9SPHN|nr:hypothetical protein [Sphingomonas gilva]RHW16827.1 hypothetical protein D1610_13975 [Sphingomonas gilva]
MDLSFTPLGRERRRVAASPDLAMMLAGVSARQAASPTARAQQHLGVSIPALAASFHSEVSDLLVTRKPE